MSLFPQSFDYSPELVASMLKQLDSIASQGLGDIPLVTLVEKVEYEALAREFVIPPPSSSRG